MNGKHWAVESERPTLNSTETDTDYVRGLDAETAKEAEAFWRKSYKLYFIKVKVRRTTPEEDKRLEE
jgi:hypothetical protein